MESKMFNFGKKKIARLAIGLLVMGNSMVSGSYVMTDSLNYKTGR